MRIENIIKSTNKKDLKKIFREYSYVFSFIILVMIAIAVNNRFLTYNNLSTIVMQSSIKGIIALGMTLVIISGEIDLSVGSTCAFVAGLGVVVLNSTENIFIMLVFCMAFGTLLGTVNGLLITKGKIASFIVTLATMSAYRSIVVQLGQGGPFNVSSEMYPSFRMIASGKILGVPNLAIIFIFISVAMAFLMRETKFGKYVYAVGSNSNAAKLTGVNVERIKMLSFSITGLLTGISAFLLSARLTSITAANVAMAFELDAIAAVAIGGTAMSGGRGRIFGTFLGIIMLQMIEGILIAAKIPPFLNGLVKGVIIVVAVLLQRKKSGE
ncbi:Monosaccharide-transporting ATPase [Alkaliphilus metalliredigens QYMF]|uniref:Monosaccharide-transporting ATPase n=1 Tax=Alkaliphilus metalliredigens (strain QYMF) TaxID=293826 RepID=A6TKG8_ALKMQ|nr:ABC transporter permease [Alkaliphilus metalliredigens]ABR46686.1 Monosaccharide-transporting ATPase [Alkaliphilus metalliredigens QYMF]